MNTDNNMHPISGFRTDQNVTIGQLFLLIGLMILLSVFASLFCRPVIILLTNSKVYWKAIITIVSSLCCFLLPALMVKWYSKAKGEPFYVSYTLPRLTLSKAMKATVLYLLMIPATSLLTWVMTLIPMPSFFQIIQDTVSNEYSMIMSPDNPPLAITLFAISVVLIAPFSEEYFFRGGLMGWFFSRSRNAHVAVWVTAVIFGLIHFEWTGMLTRIFLGAVLGYVALYGGIPMAIFLHALNNLVTFVFGLISRNPDYDLFLGDYSTTSTIRIIVMIVAVALTLPTCFYLIHRISYKPSQINEVH